MEAKAQFRSTTRVVGSAMLRPSSGPTASRCSHTSPPGGEVGAARSAPPGGAMPERDRLGVLYPPIRLTRMPTPISGQGVRRHILHQSKRANVGHIGSALSVADILAALYGGVLKGRPGDTDRDRFVMSKGHAALALYAALHIARPLEQEALATS